MIFHAAIPQTERMRYEHVLNERGQCVVYAGTTTRAIFGNLAQAEEFAADWTANGLPEWAALSKRPVKGGKEAFASAAPVEVPVEETPADPELICSVNGVPSTLAEACAAIANDPTVDVVGIAGPEKELDWNNWEPSRAERIAGGLPPARREDGWISADEAKAVASSPVDPEPNVYCEECEQVVSREVARYSEDHEAWFCEGCIEQQDAEMTALLREPSWASGAILAGDSARAAADAESAAIRAEWMENSFSEDAAGEVIGTCGCGADVIDPPAGGGNPYCSARCPLDGALQEETTEDDDPQCVCGVHRSEHALCGCGEWERRKTPVTRSHDSYVAQQELDLDMGWDPYSSDATVQSFSDLDIELRGSGQTSPYDLSDGEAQIAASW